MDGNLLYADKSCIKHVTIFHVQNKCISFYVNSINPTWKHNTMYGTSIISTLNKGLVVEGGSSIDRRRIIVRHRCSSDATVSSTVVGEVLISWSSSLELIFGCPLLDNHTICNWYLMMHHHQ